DQGAVDDGQLAGVLLPAAAAGQPLVQATPRPDTDLAVRSCTPPCVASRCGQVAGSDSFTAAPWRRGRPTPATTVSACCTPPAMPPSLDAFGATRALVRGAVPHL